MYKFRITELLIILLVSLTGCRGPNDGFKITSLQLSLSKSRIVGDGSDFATVTVLNQDGVSVMDYITIHFNGAPFSGDKISSSKPSVSTVYATYSKIRSNEEEIEVVEDKNLKFSKNVLLEQYTGTWCGWCPRAINQINNLELTDKRIVHIAYHLNDEMTYNLNSSLFQSFGFTGIPTVHTDRFIVWTGDATAISSMHSPSRIGLSLEVTGNSAQISASVGVKFGYDFEDFLELSVYLMHDSLTANQANYYNTDPNSPFYNHGSPMVNFVHRNVMIKPGTDMFGDMIPASSIDIGSTYSRKIDFTNFRCSDINKMAVVVFVACRGGKQLPNQVLNSIKGRVGEKLEFVYSDN